MSMRNMKRLVLGVAIGTACAGVVMRNSPDLYAQSLRALPVTDSLPRLIPLEALFESPAAQWGGISPDGRWLSYVKDWKGRQNVFVRRVGSNTERTITRDSVRSVPNYWWAADGKRILWVQDRAGDENYHLHVASVSDPSATPRDLTPFKNVEVEVLALPYATPDLAIITMNRRNPALADVYRVSLATGALELAATNPGTFLGYA
ncbi:MAG: hypothetical protein H0T21_09345, partial [Gemmatimonadaceae bacterium]|nr:hypothetical protein [Gemmatimonadaceae bacterium]